MKNGLVILLMILGVHARAAVQINWQSDFGETNLQSDGSTIFDDSFEFSLGGFVDGFVPGADNVSEWEEKWVELGRATYQEDNSLFSQASILNSNEAPFRVDGTDRVYIWGFNGKASGSEWILISKSDWEWPAAGFGPPIPGGGESFQIASTSGSDAILGAVNNGTAHMQSAKITLPLSYSDWVAENFMAGDASGVDEDPDDDGMKNIIEYAIGTNPKLADARSFFQITSDYQLILDRAEGRTVVWTLQDGGTLQDFTDMESGFTVVSDEPTQIIFQITDPSDLKRFYRAVASLPSS